METVPQCRRAGWRGFVFDSPLRIAVALALFILAAAIADWLEEATGAKPGGMAYGAFFAVGLTPFVVFGFVALQRTSVPAALLRWLLLESAIVIAMWMGDIAGRAVGAGNNPEFGAIIACALLIFGHWAITGVRQLAVGASGPH